jgi:uncharacterized protein YndB with AHSA1/START domain
MSRKVSKAIAQSLAVLAPPERVWAALTSGRDLGQITLGRVEMAAEPGARFLWRWGVWEKVAPRGRESAWKGTLLDVVPGSTLVLGPKPVVTLTVKGQGTVALVSVSQGAPPPGEKSEDYEHGWADFLLKLKTQLETEQLEREVLARVLVRATPAEVYRAWVQPKSLAKILPGRAQVRAKVGGRFAWQHRLGKHVHAGVFLYLQKGRKLAFTWESTQPPSEVAVEAQPAPFGTIVAAHHTGLLRMHPGQRFAQRMYWLRLLERLRCYFYFGGKIRTAE